MTKPKSTAKINPKWVRSERYINRESSWLAFNRRVLEEAEHPDNPLLERLKFLAIFESNLDEFYMVRVSGLIEQYEDGVQETTPDGLTPEEQLQMIAEIALPMREEASILWQQMMLPDLKSAGINILQFDKLSEAERADMSEYFMREVFPICTPLILSPSSNVPFISNRSLNLAVELEDDSGSVKLGRVKVPDLLSRFVRVGRKKFDFVMLEDLIRHHLAHLYSGVSIRGSYLFRVLRDADIEIRLIEAADLIETVEQTIRQRRYGDPVLLQVSSDMPAGVRRTLMRLHVLDREDVFPLSGMLGLDALWELANLEKPGLRYPTTKPYLAEPLKNSDSLFQTIASGDVLVHQPFDSFASVENFVQSAAKDESVIGIKQTLYRVGKHSGIVNSLLDSAGNGKQVAVMLELKARFDESNNLEWAKALERAGVHVTYGFADLKTHAKLCLIVRRETGGIKMYAHIGTGNYNPETAKIYTDLGLFTCDREITQDILELFNYLTGFSKGVTFRKILVAPTNLREGIIERIYREIDQHKKFKNGRIIFKLNACVDPEVIDALYEASSAGIQIDLICRGICCLRPGVTGLSERIRVVSVVGRFLEHSRAYFFQNGKSPEVWIGSADIMRRNLDRRVEVLAPVEDAQLVEIVRESVLEPYLKDNVNAWYLQPDARYARHKPKVGEKPFQVQTHLASTPLSRIVLNSQPANPSKK